MKLSRSAAVPALMALALAACGSGSAGGAASQSMDPNPSKSAGSLANVVVVHQVNASGMGGAFDPPSVSVKVGGTVRWVNGSGNIHNVTFYDTSIKPSSTMSANDKFEATFTKAGTYKYHCTFHPGMDGNVVVEG